MPPFTGVPDAEEADDDDDDAVDDCDVEDADEEIEVIDDDDDEIDVARLDEPVGETVTVEFDTTVEVIVLVVVVGGRVAK